MAKFHAAKAYHFSADGTDATTWARFTKVAGSEPAVYEFETTKAADVAALRKLIDDEVAGYTDITEVEAKAKTSRKAPAKKNADDTPDTGSSGGEEPTVDGEKAEPE